MEVSWLYNFPWTTCLKFYISPSNVVFFWLLFWIRKPCRVSPIQNIQHVVRFWHRIWKPCGTVISVAFLVNAIPLFCLPSEPPSTGKSNTFRTVLWSVLLVSLIVINAALVVVYIIRRRSREQGNFFFNFSCMLTDGKFCNLPLSFMLDETCNPTSFILLDNCCNLSSSLLLFNCCNLASHVLLASHCNLIP